jgi:hypothetical protein
MNGFERALTVWVFRSLARFDYPNIINQAAVMTGDDGHRHPWVSCRGRRAFSTQNLECRSPMPCCMVARTPSAPVLLVSHHLVEHQVAAAVGEQDLFS